MPLLKIEGEKDEYLFDPTNREAVLRENGKFGNVYAGLRISDNAPVVIKHLNPALLRYSLSLIQFRFEADAGLTHPNLRNTIEYLNIDADHFLIQEFVRGHELKDFLTQTGLFRSVSFIVRCMIRVLDALEYLHKKNIIHCDIKPSNILIGEPAKGDKNFLKHPDIKLIDLGNAMTPLSEFISTIRPFSFIYSPPEQVLHLYSLVNPSSDLFALAVTAHEILTGKNPYGSYHPEKLMHLQVSGDMVEDGNIPRELMVILKKGAARKKFPLPPNKISAQDQYKTVEEGMKMRYQNAASFRSALERFLENYREQKNFFKCLFG